MSHFLKLTNYQKQCVRHDMVAIQLTDEQVNSILVDSAHQEETCLKVFGLSTEEVAALADFFQNEPGRPAADAVRINECKDGRSHNREIPVGHERQGTRDPKAAGHEMQGLDRIKPAGLAFCVALHEAWAGDDKALREEATRLPSNIDEGGGRYSK